MGLRPKRRTVSALRDGDPRTEAGARRAGHILVSAVPTWRVVAAARWAAVLTKCVAPVVFFHSTLDALTVASSEVSRRRKRIAHRCTVPLQASRLSGRRWRHILAGQGPTIHQHLDGTVSIRYDPVVGRGKEAVMENPIAPRRM